MPEALQRVESTRGQADIGQRGQGVDRQPDRLVERVAGLQLAEDRHVGVVVVDLAQPLKPRMP